MVDHDRDAALAEFVGHTRALLERLTDDAKSFEGRIRGVDRSITEITGKLQVADRAITDLTTKVESLRDNYDAEQCRVHKDQLGTLMAEREQRKGVAKHADLGWRRVAVIAAVVGAVAAACTYGANVLDRAVHQQQIVEVPGDKPQGGVR